MSSTRRPAKPKRLRRNAHHYSSGPVYGFTREKRPALYSAILPRVTACASDGTTLARSPIASGRVWCLCGDLNLKSRVDAEPWITRCSAKDWSHDAAMAGHGPPYWPSPAPRRETIASTGEVIQA